MQDTRDLQSEINFNTHQGLVQHIGELAIAKAAAEARAAVLDRELTTARGALTNISEEVSTLRKEIEGLVAKIPPQDAPTVHDTGYRTPARLSPDPKPVGDVDIPTPKLYPGALED